MSAVAERARQSTRRGNRLSRAHSLWLLLSSVVAVVVVFECSVIVEHSGGELFEQIGPQAFCALFWLAEHPIYVSWRSACGAVQRGAAQLGPQSALTCH